MVGDRSSGIVATESRQFQVLGDGRVLAETGVLRAQALDVDVSGVQERRLRNPDGRSPFVNPAYALPNLAIGGMAGGDPSAVPFPVHTRSTTCAVYAPKAEQRSGSGWRSPPHPAHG
jgi:hypothetical protein